LDDDRRALLRRRHRALLEAYGQVQEPTTKEAHATTRRIAGDLVRAGWQDVDSTQLRREVRAQQAFLEGLQDEVLAAASHLGYRIEWDLLACEFPTGAANAEVHPFPDASALVLIHQGLMRTTWEVSKLIANHVSVETSETKTRFDFNSPIWDDDDAKDADVIRLAAICAAYFSTEDIGWAPRVPVPDPIRVLIATGITNDCERFVIAHEVAHAIAGDLERDTHARPTPVGEIEVVVRTWQEELAADRLAMQLLLTSAGLRSHAPGQEPGLVLATAPAGAVFLFWLQSAIEPIADTALEQLMGHKPSDFLLADHPPPRLRKEFLWRTLRQLGVRDEWLPVPRYVDAWFKSIAPALGGAVRAGARTLPSGRMNQSPIERQERAIEREIWAPAVAARAQEEMRQDAYWSAVADEMERGGSPPDSNITSTTQ
jgi:hypothetical protein